MDFFCVFAKCSILSSFVFQKRARVSYLYRSLWEKPLKQACNSDFPSSKPVSSTYLEVLSSAWCIVLAFRAKQNEKNTSLDQKFSILPRKAPGFILKGTQRGSTRFVEKKAIFHNSRKNVCKPKAANVFSKTFRYFQNSFQKKQSNKTLSFEIFRKNKFKKHACVFFKNFREESQVLC
jgi:hypothetical protein